LAVIILATLVGAVRFRQLPPSLRYLTLFASFEVFTELLSRALIRVFHLKSNLFLIPIAAIGEVGLLALAYRQVLRSAAFGRALPWVLGLFSSYALLEALAGLGTVRFAPTVQVSTDLLMLGLAGLYFRQLLHELQVNELRHEPFFWMSAGMTIYALGDLQIALFSNYLLLHSSLQLQLLVIVEVHLFLLLTFYSGCGLALWMRPQK
jgi:hypothetical protein